MAGTYTVISLETVPKGHLRVRAELCDLVVEQSNMAAPVFSKVSKEQEGETKTPILRISFRSWEQAQVFANMAKEVAENMMRLSAV